jgi:sterol desaturase/sphingolipid hydroxylase (fatty acid hydroxylase superfamily)
MAGRGGDFWRHGSNLTVAIAILAFAAEAAWQRHVVLALAVLLGLALIPPIEYVSHRFGLHAKPSRYPWLARIQARIHYDHHRDPNRLEWLFAPLWLLGPLATGYGLLYWLLSGDGPWARAMVLGNLIGFLWYEWVHYRAHTPSQPRTSYGRWIKKIHLWHHFLNEDYWFGVTSPVVDMLVGTFPNPETVPRSATVRDLFPDAAV